MSLSVGRFYRTKLLVRYEAQYTQKCTNLLQLQAKYAIFLVACQLSSGRRFCLVQGCDTLCASSAQPILNSYDCLLITVTQEHFLLWTVVLFGELSVVHECLESCKFVQEESTRRVERQRTSEAVLA